jgi:hypothetical protein
MRFQQSAVVASFVSSVSPPSRSNIRPEYPLFLPVHGRASAEIRARRHRVLRRAASAHKHRADPV